MFLKNVINDKDAKPTPKEVKTYLYGRVCFRTENYLENTILSAKERYDVIMCLSTVKYIHLNFGDVGIKTLFLKAYD